MSSTNTNNENKSNFTDKREALEFLIQEKYKNDLKKGWSARVVENLEFERLKSSRTAFGFRIALGIAATFLLVIASTFFFLKSNTNLKSTASSMIAQSEIVLLTDMTHRGDLPQLKEKVLKAQNAMEMEDYQLALTIYKELIEIENSSAQDKFFYAICVLKAQEENNSLAIAFLEELAASKSGFSTDAQWFLSLAYIMNNKNDLAEKQLKKLNLSSSLQSNNVKRLLDLLNN